MATKSKAAGDPLAQLLATSISAHKQTLPAKAIADLKAIEAHIAKGGPVPFYKDMIAFLKTTYGITIGRSRLATLAIENGITPWWSHK